MHWNRRVVGATSGVAGAALLAAAVLVVRPTMLGVVGKPSVVWASQKNLSAPVLARGGQSLTGAKTVKALLITPQKVGATLEQRMARAMGVNRLGQKPELWLVSRKDLRRFESGAGVQVVDVRIETARPGIAAGVAAAIGRDDGRLVRGPWVFRQGVYQLASSSAPIHTTLNMALTRSIQSQLHGPGSVMVVGQHGSIEALATTESGTRWLSARSSVNLAMLPPLLSVALRSGTVSHALSAKAISLNQMARSWGTQSIERGLMRLGWGSAAVTGDLATKAHLPSRVTPALFSQGTGLEAGPAALARSYLPFIDNGRMPGLTINAASPDKSPVVPGAFAETLAQIPKVTVAGVAFRVWRPYGQYAVVIDVAQHRVAVLQGAAVSDVLPVMQTIAHIRS